MPTNFFKNMETLDIIAPFILLVLLICLVCTPPILWAIDSINERRWQKDSYVVTHPERIEIGSFTFKRSSEPLYTPVSGVPYAISYDLETEATKEQIELFDEGLNEYYDSSLFSENIPGFGHVFTINKIKNDYVDYSVGKLLIINAPNFKKYEKEIYKEKEQSLKEFWNK